MAVKHVVHMYIVTVFCLPFTASVLILFEEVYIKLKVNRLLLTAVQCVVGGVRSLNVLALINDGVGSFASNHHKRWSYRERVS